jgi:hypothetical protein
MKVEPFANTMPNSFQPHIPKWKGLCIPNEGEPVVPPLCRLVTPQVDQAKDLKIAIRHARAESMGFKETRIKNQTVSLLVGMWRNHDFTTSE